MWGAAGFGPGLWNIGYDAVLRVDLPLGGDVVGYADDTLILVEGSSLPEMINRANIYVAIVVGEIKRLGLGVSPLKTGIVAFGAPPEAPGAVRVDSVLVPVGSFIRYLGLDLDAG